MRIAGAQTRSVALTFDDGPSPYTQRILDTLQREHAKATFFTLGYQLAEFPLPLQRAVAEGHAIGDHTWNHADLTKLPRARRSPGDRRPVRGAAAASASRARGSSARRTGPTTTRRCGRRAAAGMLTVLWTIDSERLQGDGPARRWPTRCSPQAEPGAIILMHDGGGDRTVTSRGAAAASSAGCASAGFRMVTVPELLMTNPAPAEQNPVARAPVA